MSKVMAENIVLLVGLYILIGLVYSVYFFKIRISKIDPVFTKAKWSVKFLMVPATIMLWPLIASCGEKK